MGFRIVIAGESQCISFAESCLVADFLSQNLPDFCYDRIEVPVLDWKAWLCRINKKNKWHHLGSPLIWKEMLMAGSTPFYIGNGSQFLDYCYSYYDFDALFGSDEFEELLKNNDQFKKKMSAERRLQNAEDAVAPVLKNTKNNFVVTIFGAGNPLTMHLVDGLLEINGKDETISKVYLFDDNCSPEFLLSVEKQCSYVQTQNPGKVVKYVNKIGMALTSTDLLIVLDHVPLSQDKALGDWLYANKLIMDKLSLMINAAGARKMYIVFPNLGPACYNATWLRRLVTITKDHIVVATSDLGLEILPIAAEIANVPSKNIFCPPVWGFVGINHLVDIKTTIQRYDTFEPYTRYTKVKSSSLKIGSLTPELRTMEYLMYFDESLWLKVSAAKARYPRGQPWLSKSIAVLNLVKLWLFRVNPNDVVNLGLHCDGSFGLTFDGIFSQPARLVNDEWVPAKDFLLPKDFNVKLQHLQEMAIAFMNLEKGELPQIRPYYPCTCKPRKIKKKRTEIWY